MSAMQQDPRVQTTCGTVEGLRTPLGEAYLGIPYAKPPVGALRLRPTEPPEPWEGVRSCKQFGHVAPQLFIKEFTVLRPDDVVDEDCLYLNVFTPAADTGRRPVLVFLHGGAFQKGSGNHNFRPDAYVEAGIVVINMNFRLGALGFLDFSEYLGEEYAQSGNNGLLDAIQALRWVRENVARFGGDPDNVTIMGQSSGAKMVATLLIMETAKGLFQKAIVCSGGVQCTRDRRTAWRTTEQFMRDAGLTKETAASILTMPWQDIVRAQTDLFAGLNLHTCGPVFDGVNFSEDDALGIIRHGKASMVPLMVGTNRDEMQLYYNAYPIQEFDEKLAVRLFGSNAPIVLREYGKIARDETYERTYVNFLTEYIYRSGALDLCDAYTEAGNDQVYLFRNDFDRQPARAGHSLESQFLMKMPKDNAEKSDAYYRLADAAVDAAVAFLRTGIPSAAGFPQWPSYANGKQLLVWDLESHVETAEPSWVAPDLPKQVYSLP